MVPHTGIGRIGPHINKSFLNKLSPRDVTQGLMSGIRNNKKREKAVRCDTNNQDI
jgi:hypothetical protein